MSADIATSPIEDDTDVLPLVANLAGRTAVCLDEVLAIAELSTRVDLKYVIPIEQLGDFVDRLPRRFAALEITGRRVFRYESMYFDTADFAFYRSHVQGRRKRYKARSRSYCDTGSAMLEVKLKGPRGQTVKVRLPYDYHHRAVMTSQGKAFLERVVGEQYGLEVPMVQPVLMTRYRRATLVDVEQRTRLTIDTHLGWSDSRTTRRADDLALIESKSMSGPGAADTVLCGMGVRPVRMSKYCLGVALLHPDIAANPWNRLLRSQFGWQRDPVS